MLGKTQITHNIYYTILKSDFNGLIKFLIGDNDVAIYGIYTKGIVRLYVLGNPSVIHNNYKIYVESKLISYNEIDIGDLDYEYFSDVNLLISLYKRYKNLPLREISYVQRLIIENNIKIHNYEISFLELIVSKKIIPYDEICNLSKTYSGLLELMLIYY